MNSRNKGKRIEREFRDYLREYGYQARRGQQYCGGTDSADVVSEELSPFFHIEVKGVERLNVHDAVAQAVRDCPQGKYRIVAHKKNRSGWLITLPGDDFMNLVKEWRQRSE